MDLQTFEYLLGFLTPQQRVIVLGILSAIGAACIAVLFIKSAILNIMGVPKPNDPPWKTHVYRALTWIDSLGFNTATIRSLIEAAQKERQLLIAQGVMAIPPHGPAPHMPASVPPPGDDLGGPQ